FSWVSSQDAVAQSQTDLPNRIPGLYAVVTPQQFGLAGNWRDVTGGIIGMGNGSSAQFTNAEVLTRVVASDCQGDVSASGPICSSQPSLTSTSVSAQNGSATVESNNLTLVEQSALAFPNANLVVTDILASDNVPAGSTTATCLPGQSNHLFIKDNDGDNG